MSLSDFDNYQVAVAIEDIAMLNYYVGVLMACPHDHHFAVHKDRLRLLCSEFALECIGLHV
jgi:hypothetical protein